MSQDDDTDLKESIKCLLDKSRLFKGHAVRFNLSLDCNDPVIIDHLKKAKRKLSIVEDNLILALHKLNS